GSRWRRRYERRPKKRTSESPTTRPATSPGRRKPSEFTRRRRNRPRGFSLWRFGPTAVEDFVSSLCRRAAHGAATAAQHVGDHGSVQEERFQARVADGARDRVDVGDGAFLRIGG